MWSTHLIFLLRYSSLLDQLLTVFLQDGWHAADLLVHERLREHWLVNLIVAVATVTDLKHTRH